MGVTGSNPCTTGVCTCPPRPRPPPLLSARQPSIVILRLAPLSLCAAVGAGGQRAMSLVWFRGEWGHCCSDTACLQTTGRWGFLHVQRSACALLHKPSSHRLTRDTGVSTVKAHATAPAPLSVPG